MNKRRIDRLNSLLKEVISEVIKKKVKNVHVSQFLAISEVKISPDMRKADVFISIIGEDQEKEKTLEALTSAAGFIGVNASKMVVLRYFPSLHFHIDRSIDKLMRIEEIIQKINKDEISRSDNCE